MANIDQVYKNPKKSTQYQQSYNQQTKMIDETAMEYWRVIFDSWVDDPSLCGGGATDGTNSLPVINQPYSGAASTMTVRRIQPQLDVASAGKAYDVQVEYSSQTQTGNSQQSGKWDISVSIDGVAVTETVYKDRTGKAILNSAGMHFAQQPSATHYDQVIKVSWKSRTADTAAIDALEGKLNSAPFTLSVASLGYSKSFETESTMLARCPHSCVIGGKPSETYWNCEVELQYRAPITGPANSAKAGQQVSGWSLFIADMGYSYIDAANITTENPLGLTPFVDKNKQQLNEPGQLDGTGAKNTTTTAYFLWFAPTQYTGSFSPLITGIA